MDWRLQRLAGRCAERIVVPSASVASAAERLSGISSDKIVIIPNGVDVELYRGVGRWGGRRPYRVVFIGRLDPIKRIDDLLAAGVLLKDQVRVDLYGDGVERAHIAEQAKSQPWVTLHGAIEDPRVALQNADVLVLPSEAEGFGLVLIEAMAAGVPIVATDVAGIRDVVRNGETGLLVRAGEAAELAEAIGKICSDSSLRERLVENAHSVVRATYQWDRIIPQYRNLVL